MYTRKMDTKTAFKYVSFLTWGFGGVFMVGVPATLMIEGEGGVPRLMAWGFVSFMVLRSFLLWREYRDAKDGF